MWFEKISRVRSHRTGLTILSRVTFAILDRTHGITRSDIEKHFSKHISDPTGEFLNAKYPSEFLEDGQKRCEQPLAEFDAWKDACNDIDQKHNVPALNKAEYDASEEFETVEQDIIDSPTTSFAGIAVKLAIWGYGQLSEGNTYFAEQAVLSALETATALSGLPTEFWKPPIKYRQFNPSEAA